MMLSNLFITAFPCEHFIQTYKGHSAPASELVMHKLENKLSRQMEEEMEKNKTS